MKRSTKKVLTRSWGYILLAVLAYGWFGAHFGAGVLSALSGAIVVFCLFQAPVWCCAVNRGGDLCRNNAYGILLGCHLRQHKWQKMKMAVRRQHWSTLLGRVTSGLGGRAALVSTVAGLVSTVASVTVLLAGA